MKVTKENIKNYVKHQLGTNPSWSLKALVRVLDFQTQDEINHEQTEIRNGVGFTGSDGEILTSIAKQYIQRGSLSPKQVALVMKKMPKYWNQIIMISDQEKLEQLVVKSLN